VKIIRIRGTEQFAGDFAELPSILSECGVDEETTAIIELKTPKDSFQDLLQYQILI
jgi:hypothetical protein